MRPVPSAPARPARIWILAAALAVALVACTGGDRPELSPTIETPATPASTVEVASLGEIVIGEDRYAMEFRCFDLINGIVAVGRSDTEAGSVTALVEATSERSYVLVVFGEVETGRAVESAADDPAGFEREGLVVRGESIRWIDLGDAASGPSDAPIGDGSVEVSCAVLDAGDIPESLLARSRPG